MKSFKKDSRILVVMNHYLNQDQLNELNDNGISKVEYLPEDLKASWGAINPENLTCVCREILEYIKQKQFKNVILAGQPAATVLLSELIECGTTATSFYAYSERVSEEATMPDGSVIKKSRFEHRGFYEYPHVGNLRYGD